MAEWFVARNGKQAGPFSDEQMIKMVRKGAIKPDDTVWRDGLADWMAWQDVPELRIADGNPGAVAVGSVAVQAGSNTAANTLADAVADARAAGSPSDIGFTLYRYHGDPYCHLLAVGEGCIYHSIEKKGAHDKAHEAIRGGAHPADVMAKNHTKIASQQLREIRHQRDSDCVDFEYTNDHGKRKAIACFLANRAEAAHAAKTAARVMGFSDEPRQREATVLEITLVPAGTGGFVLLMLCGVYLGSISDPNEIRVGKPGLFKAIGHALGPTGTLLVMGLVAAVTFAYWLYRYLRRPTVDLFGPAGAGR